MHGDQAERREQLHREIAVAHRVHRIASDRRESEQLCDELAIQWDGGAGDRAGAERHHVDPLPRIGEPPEIALEHLHVREQMVRKVDRLRPLQMRVAGDDQLRMPPGQVDERTLDGAERVAEIIAFGAEVEAQVERDLVVAASGRCAASRRHRRCAASAPPRCSCGCLRARYGK